MLAKPNVRVNGADHAYDDAGSGPAVILLHGALGDRRMWDTSSPPSPSTTASSATTGAATASPATPPESSPTGHEWPAEMPDLARERVLAMAEAQLRLMAVGPARTPADLGPGVRDLATTMCRLVFEREWGGPASTELGARPQAKGPPA